MDFSKIFVCFFSLICVCLFGKAFSCKPSKRSEDTWQIRHSNGLCINNLINGSLVWSRDCNTFNSFFLVTYNHSILSLFGQRCVLPSTNISDPGEGADLLLKNITDCTKNVVKFRPTCNGQLQYFYKNRPYKLCIGSRTGHEPRDNDTVSILKSVCDIDSSCKLSYAYQRTFSENEVATLECETCSTIRIVWAEYGVLINSQNHFVLNKSDKNCVTNTAITVMIKKCNGTRKCSFEVQDSDFLSNICRNNTALVVQYRCQKTIPAAQNDLKITVEGQHRLSVKWPNDNGVAKKFKYQLYHVFKLCWNKVGETRQCLSKVYPGNFVNETLSGLQPATKYSVTVEKYLNDGKSIRIKVFDRRQKIAMTRSAAPNPIGTKSTTAFQIQLGKLQADDIYVQIVLSKLKTIAKPTKHPEIVEQYDKNTVDCVPYIAAEFGKTHFDQIKGLFTVGDNQLYSEFRSNSKKRKIFRNVHLERDTYYSVFQRTYKSLNLSYDSDWMDVVCTASAMGTITPSDKENDEKTDQPCTDCGKKMDDKKELYIYIGVPVGVVVAVLLGIGLFCSCRRARNGRTDKSSENAKPRKPKDNSSYESLDLTKMNSGDDHYESLDGNSVGDKVSVENEDAAYTELNTVRDKESKYESLKYTRK
ncbi:uncharacterized protein LOC114542474 [Dendronephthya gigantea]|uniref:uncharacterized protein LOC114542474 n=1 Tax=Dendronephthya gigantea TaxID=151771 RepID=UPI0010690F24|nr:uncharacterized protein LOC114542474 [Dendronephthya gigantea]